MLLIVTKHRQIATFSLYVSRLAGPYCVCGYHKSCLWKGFLSSRNSRTVSDVYEVFVLMKCHYTLVTHCFDSKNSEP